MFPGKKAFHKELSPVHKHIREKHDVHKYVHRDTTMKATNKMQIYRLIYYS